MKLPENLENKRFGKLVALEYVGSNTGPLWLCECDCGNILVVRGSNLGRHTNSCGCETIIKRTKHGLARHPLYLMWFNIMRRCGSDKYGGHYKNIVIYEEWKNVIIFIKYVEETLGEKPTSSHSIDRIENKEGYIPGNIRWATKLEQSNNRDYVRRYTYKGETNTIRYFSTKYKVNFNTLRTRLWKGMTICEALEKD